MNIDDIIGIIQRYYNKLLLTEKYIPSKKIPCPTTLFRAQIASEYSETIGDDYGLSAVREEYRYLRND